MRSSYGSANSVGMISSTSWMLITSGAGSFHISSGRFWKTASVGSYQVWRQRTRQGTRSSALFEFHSTAPMARINSTWLVVASIGLALHRSKIGSQLQRLHHTCTRFRQRIPGGEVGHVYRPRSQASLACRVPLDVLKGRE